MTDHSSINYTYAAPRIPYARAGRSDWLQLWLDGETFDPASLESLGFQPNQYYAVVIYRPRNDTFSGPQFTVMVQQESARRGINGPLFPYENSAILFHPVEDPQQTTRLKRKTEEIREQLANRLHGSEIYCGVGRPMRGLEMLRASFNEAEDAVSMCSRFQSQARSTFFGNSSLYGLLLSLKNPTELQRFCATWLTNLIEYDNQQHSELLATLSTYFANNGNTALTAKELKIHRNTLAYRLNRIAEITCLDLDDADVRLNLHLALKAHEVLMAQASLPGIH
jgi:purine catabolism regulator